MPSWRTTTILPALCSDNYLNLMPGAKRQITIDLPHANGAPISRVALRIDGWRLDRPNCRLGLGGVPVVFNEHALAVDQAVATFASARVATCVRDAADRTRRRPRHR
ncbi:TPA: beta-mannosidase [Burkholderia cenocepacia]